MTINELIQNFHLQKEELEKQIETMKEPKKTLNCTKKTKKTKKSKT